MVYEIRWRKGEAGIWAARNPVLSLGEPGYETDSGKFKIGNGVTPWLGLPYFIDKVAIDALIDEASVEAPAGPEGKSAYEIAVDKGFSGTESQWLSSLEGAPGAPGTDGQDGTDGTNGESVTVTLVPAASWPPAADSNPLHLYFRVP